jgi:hypothetical protein
LSTLGVPFPNPTYFNHLLGFSDHIQLQVTNKMSDAMFYSFIQTLTYEKWSQLKRLSGSLFKFPPNFSLHVFKMPYKGNF